MLSLVFAVLWINRDGVRAAQGRPNEALDDSEGAARSEAERRTQARKADTESNRASEERTDSTATAPRVGLSDGSGEHDRSRKLSPKKEAVVGEAKKLPVSKIEWKWTPPLHRSEELRETLSKYLREQRAKKRKSLEKHAKSYGATMKPQQSKSNLDSEELDKTLKTYPEEVRVRIERNAREHGRIVEDGQRRVAAVMKSTNELGTLAFAQRSYDIRRFRYMMSLQLQRGTGGELDLMCDRIEQTFVDEARRDRDRWR